jgi:hypothetical protein
VASDFQGLRIFKIQTEGPPIPISRTLLWGPADNISMHGDTAYVSDTFYGLWRFDLANVKNPVETGFFPLKHGKKRIAIAHSHIFVAAGYAGLFIFRDNQGRHNLNISSRPGNIVIFDD